MKTLLIALFIFSITNLSAQNKNYLKSVTTKTNATQIVQLQNKAAKFNIKTLEAYEKNAKTTYTVTFKNPNGKIIATYNNKGVIVKTIEEYVNVKSSKQVVVEVLKSYPKSMIVGNIYKILYSNKEKSKKLLEIIIKKENKVETVFFDLGQKTNDFLLVKN